MQRRLPRSITENMPKLTATSAKKDFALSERDLDGIDCIEVQNPYHPSAAPMRLFEKDVIMRAAYAKHGSPEGIREAIEKRRRVAEKRAETRRRVTNQRRTELRTALTTRGLHLREDSRLCDEYISSGRGSINDIVEIMEEMDFYFKCTSYSKIRDRIMDQEWADIRSARERYGREMPWMPPPDRDEVSERAKAEALHDFVGQNGIDDPRIPRSLRRQ